MLSTGLSMRVSIQGGIELGHPILRLLGCKSDFGSFATTPLPLMNLGRSKSTKIFGGELVGGSHPLAHDAVDGIAGCGGRGRKGKSRGQD